MIAVEAGAWEPQEKLETRVAGAVGAVIAELDLRSGASELGVTFTDDRSMRALNRQWRGKDKPTNVLSFPAFPDPSPSRIPPMLGDIVIAFETVRREATLDAKPFDHHLTHLLVHGLLHLLGYDHETDDDADHMEATERRVLARLAIADPYTATDRSE
ncbi:rRNA maturation RNase YbeY [Nitratireductor sp. CAU 1489]|uniref:Endoribonuclease YbeY n=1 Tax=Nitratireductor arenosus TaxID=2682096 RepID=A0A844QFZ3_9HYPH|nr:rRNA maturation RNase YbeY [Nitratireductor arenosus]MVA98205.1 rRNA maturation RNase YbeY [Nitratireductor arenosus]